MTFFSLPFVALVAAALLLYYLAPGKWRWLVLLGASLAFYLWKSPAAGAYILFTVLTNWLAGLRLGALNAKAKAAEDKAALKRRKRCLLAAALVLNFGLLFVVKYWNDAAKVVSSVSGLSLPVFDLLMPLGLSFYVFQSAGYVIDCYRGKHAPEKNVLKFALFVSFFPQVVQGPISRFHQLQPQLIEPHRFEADNLKYGIQLALWGYLKKMIVADRCVAPVSTVFNAPEKFGGAVYVIAVVFYCIQLYCDFSGGIDITRGVAQMFGIDLVENFRRPIFAVSLADYWRRWHITLGTWMRDYVFYPLSFSKAFVRLSRFGRKHLRGKASKVLPMAAATFVVYIIIGIWHGANLRYIFFGFYNGVLMTAAVLLASPFARLRKKLRCDKDTWWYHAFQVLRTALLVLVGRYITRAPRLLVALQMLKKTLLHPCLYQLSDGTLGTLGIETADVIVVLAGVAVLLTVETMQERGVKIRKALERRSVLVQWLCLFVPLLLLTLLGIFRGTAIQAEFIYQQF